ncbi:MAG: transcriptional repressor NrdR [Actinomycetia bacterium]|nr:transcriptional repressor NrdR [Actinomycetes bacterium]
MQCPECGSVDDRVVDSRTADEGRTIRRRRECLTCARRFTTFERLEEEPVLVTKRSGQTLPFDASKISSGVRAAAHNRPVSDQQIATIVAGIEDTVRLEGGSPATERIGVLVLEGLSELDQVAYLRFASVYKDFDDATDFERELVLLNKSTAPKQH